MPEIFRARLQDRATVLALASLMLAALPAVAQAQLPRTLSADELFKQLTDQVVSVQRFRGGVHQGFDRGYVAETRPRRTRYGDCLYQRFSFNLPQLRIEEPPRPRPGDDDLQSVTVENRYRRRGWQHEPGIADCGTSAQGAWVVAADDLVFTRAADLLEQVFLSNAQPRRRTFAYSCEDNGRPCAAAEAELEAFERAIATARLENENQTVIATALIGDGRPAELTAVADAARRVTRVRLKIQLRPLV